MMKRLIKAGLMVLMGIVIWINGSMVKEAKAQECAYGGHVVSLEGYSICNYPLGGCQQHSPGQIPPSCQPQPQQPANPKPVVKKPSSYGAVAWDIKRGLYATSHHQLSKQAAFTEAMSKCGSSCQIAMQYANQCTAVAYGLEKGGTYSWTVTAGLTTSKAERDATKKCSKVAKNCQILLSECSLAGDVNQTQQYKGLGE